MGVSHLFLFIASLSIITLRADDDIDGYLKFPEDFKFGVSTAAYQIEGAWNVSDKGINVWDKFTHENLSPIVDRSNGDVAADSYNKYKEDIVIMKNLGVDSYRISLSWSRILPNGFPNKISNDGIQYYKNLLDDLNAVGIKPLVTLYHWDHPVALEEMGGWTNELMVTWFADYARIVFKELGDRIKMFVTINEPNILCYLGYGKGSLAPGKKLPLFAPYLCVHNILKAHAKAYRIYDSEFRKSQGGQVGIALHCDNHYAKYANDKESVDIGFAFNNGWLIDPIYSKKGDYPAAMKQRIHDNSKLEGYPRSRLPKFTKSEIDEIRGSADYFGLNHYTSRLVEPTPKSSNTLWYKDSGIITSYNVSWPDTATEANKIVPQGFGDTLRYLKEHYDNPTIYVTENGMSDNGKSLEDHQRIEYFHDYIREMLLAVNRDGCNVKGYFAWSLLDNFEWMNGYTQHFGLVSVDFKDPNRARTPKLSYGWYKELVRTRKLPRIDAV